MNSVSRNCALRLIALTLFVLSLQDYAWAQQHVNLERGLNATPTYREISTTSISTTGT